METGYYERPLLELWVVRGSTSLGITLPCYIVRWDVETDINIRLGKAATVFRQLNRIWPSSSLSQDVKLKLYMSTVVATALCQ